MYSYLLSMDGFVNVYSILNSKINRNKVMTTKSTKQSKSSHPTPNLLQKPRNKILNLPLILLLLDIIVLGINNQNLTIFLPPNPCLMSLVDFPNILQGNGLLAFPVSLLYALEAQLGGTFQVDDGFQGEVFHDGLAQGVVHCVLDCLEIAFPMHDLPKNMPIRQWRPLRKQHLAPIVLPSLLPELTSRVQSIQLESKSPSLGVLVVSLKDIATRGILPLIYGLFYCVGVQEGQEGCLPGADIALYGDYGHLFLLYFFGARLSLTSKFTFFEFLSVIILFERYLSQFNIHIFLSFTHIINNQTPSLQFQKPIPFDARQKIQHKTNLNAVINA